jgi:hypothetical protein
MAPVVVAASIVMAAMAVAGVKTTMVVVRADIRMTKGVRVKIVTCG